LQEIIDPSTFKSYDELKRRLHQVLGIDSRGNTDAGPVASAPAARAKPAAHEAEEDATLWNTDEDDEDLSFFKRIAEEED